MTTLLERHLEHDFAHSATRTFIMLDTYDEDLACSWHSSSFQMCPVMLRSGLCGGDFLHSLVYHVSIELILYSCLYRFQPLSLMNEILKLTAYKNILYDIVRPVLRDKETNKYEVVRSCSLIATMMTKMYTTPNHENIYVCVTPFTLSIK